MSPTSVTDGLRLDTVRPLVAGCSLAAKLTSVFVLLLGDVIWIQMTSSLDGGFLPAAGGGDMAAIFVLFRGSNPLK